MLIEIKEFLTEYVYTAFYTHYYFEHQGQKLNDYTEVALLNLKDEPILYMRVDKYDDKAVRNHVRRVKEILFTPTLLSTMQENEGIPEEEKKGEEGEQKPEEEKKTT